MHQKVHTDQELKERRKRFLEAVHLQEMEDNPLDSEQLAMFEMFERENWTDKQIKAHLDARAAKRANLALK